MALAHAYCVTNLIRATPTILASSFFVGAGTGSGTFSWIGDGRLDSQYKRTGETSGCYFFIDLGAPTAVDTFALLNTNIGSLSVPVRLELYGNDDLVTPNTVTAKALTTFSQTKPRHRDHVLSFPSVTRRYWKGVFVWSGGGSLDLRFGELFLGRATTLTRVTALGGRGQSSSVLSRHFETVAGERRSLFEAGPFRERRLKWSDVSDAERTELLAMWDAAKGGGNPLLWIESRNAVQTAAADVDQECIYGRLREDLLEWDEIDYGPGGSRWEPSNLVIRSLGREVGQ